VTCATSPGSGGDRRAGDLRRHPSVQQPGRGEAAPAAVAASSFRPSSPRRRSRARRFFIETHPDPAHRRERRPHAVAARPPRELLERTLDLPGPGPEKRRPCLTRRFAGGSGWSGSTSTASYRQRRLPGGGERAAGRVQALRRGRTGWAARAPKHAGPSDSGRSRATGAAGVLGHRDAQPVLHVEALNSTRCPFPPQEDGVVGEDAVASSPTSRIPPARPPVKHGRRFRPGPGRSRVRSNSSSRRSSGHCVGPSLAAAPGRDGSR